MARRSRGRAGRVLLLLLAVVVVALLVAAVATWRMVVHPATDAPAPVDAVVVLSGDHGERLPAARALIDDGLTHVLVYVGTTDGARTDEVCDGPQSFDVYCPRPQPDSTRAEARAVGRLARAHGWRSIAVVTSTPHVSRAALLFRRCFDGDVRMLGRAPLITVAQEREQVRQEWQKLLYTVVDRGC